MYCQYRFMYCQYIRTVYVQYIYIRLLHAALNVPLCHGPGPGGRPARCVACLQESVTWVPRRYLKGSGGSGDNATMGHQACYTIACSTCMHVVHACTHPPSGRWGAYHPAVQGPQQLGRSRHSGGAAASSRSASWEALQVKLLATLLCSNAVCINVAEPSELQMATLECGDGCSGCGLR